MIPILLGLGLYSFLGIWLYGDVLAYITGLFSGMVMEGGIFATIITWVVGILITIGAYFIVSWTFVLTLGILAGPFNDYIVERVFKLNDKPVDNTFEQFGYLKGSLKIIVFEAKKFSIIVLLSMICFVMGLIPMLTPIALILNVIVFCCNFFGSPWSHLKYPASTMVKSLLKYFISNIIYGTPLLLLTTIPVINLMIYPYCVVFFTQLMIDRDQKEMKAS
jgi:uncharacterized protein involved in cysteine biosynthesis